MTEADIKYVKTWAPVAAGFSPTCGHVCVNEYGIPVLAGYLLECPNGVAYLDAFIAAPGLDKPIRRKCLNNMVQYMTDVAKSRGVHRLIATPSYDSMAAILTEMDWTLFDRKVDYLWRNI
jgi:hypothetical protein